MLSFPLYKVLDFFLLLTSAGFESMDMDHSLGR